MKLSFKHLWSMCGPGLNTVHNSRFKQFVSVQIKRQSDDGWMRTNEESNGELNGSVVMTL